MKRSFLVALGIEKDIIDQIMAENGQDIELLKEKSKETIAELQDKLTEANTNVKELQETTSGDSELETKYNSLVEEFNTYKTTKESEFETYKTEVESEKKNSAILSDIGRRLAKEGASPTLSDLMLKGFDISTAKCEGDKITNMEDIITEFKTSYGDAFGTKIVEGTKTPTPPSDEGAIEDDFIDGFDSY